MGKPIVSIGLPVYNGEDFVAETMDSLLRQTFGDFEIIISDNASTDKTAEICLNYAEKDSRIKYFRNSTNLGAAENYNKVFRLSEGKYFKWAAHDDCYEPEYIEKCLEKLVQNENAVLCYTQRIIIDETGNMQEKVKDELVLDSPSPAERFGKFLKIFRYHTIHCDPVFGLIKSSELAKTPLIAKFPTSDMTLLAELSLLGVFCEVGEYLFLRRRHAKMSTKMNPKPSQRLAWFDPSLKGKVQYPRWRWLAEFMRSVKRTEIGISEKIKCYLHIALWTLFWSKSLGADLIKGLLYRFTGREF